jgi:hypothetical protein
MNPHRYAHFIFDKVTKNKTMEKRQPLQQMLLGKVAICLSKLKLDPCLSHYTSINSKWIKDLNIRPETLQLVQERAGNTLEVIDIGKDFLSTTQAAQQLRERMDKWDYMKLKSFCARKEMVSKLKTLPMVWEKNLCQLYIRQWTDNQNI